MMLKLFPRGMHNSLPPSGEIRHGQVPFIAGFRKIPVFSDHVYSRVLPS